MITLANKLRIYCYSCLSFSQLMPINYMNITKLTVLLVFCLFISKGYSEYLCFDILPNQELYSYSATGRDSIIPEIVLVEGGTFKMGSHYGEADEEPVHEIELNTFYMGRYEVTNQQFCAFLNARKTGKKVLKTWVNTADVNNDIIKVGKNYKVTPGREKYPVTSVSWFGASAYCDWLRDKTGDAYRLPTEAEWEYAAKGGRKTHNYVYSGSEILMEVAWFSWNSEATFHQVGGKRPNELGIYDMCGNVQEWCNDWYSETYYNETDRLNPTGPEHGAEVVVRGGHWSLSIEYVRNDDRYKYKPTKMDNTLGFRVVKE